MEKYMIGTKATHLMGDISREEPDLCYITEQDDNNYIGHWVTGFGFINVKFPKATTRELTDEEIERWNNTWVQLSPQFPARKLKVD